MSIINIYLHNLICFADVFCWPIVFSYQYASTECGSVCRNLCIATRWRNKSKNRAHILTRIVQKYQCEMCTQQWAPGHMSCLCSEYLLLFFLPKIIGANLPVTFSRKFAIIWTLDRVSHQPLTSLLYLPIFSLHCCSPSLPCFTCNYPSRPLKKTVLDSYYSNMASVISSQLLMRCQRWTNGFGKG